jgi:hypothetical protein
VSLFLGFYILIKIRHEFREVTVDEKWARGNVVEILCYKPEVASSIPDEAILF